MHKETIILNTGVSTRNFTFKSFVSCQLMS